MGKAAKWASFENLSTTTKMVVKPFEFGRPVIKSNERSSQTAEGGGMG